MTSRGGGRVVSLPRITAPNSLSEFNHSRLHFVCVMEKINAVARSVMGAAKRVVCIVDGYILFCDMQRYIKQVIPVGDIQHAHIQSVKLDTVVQKQLMFNTKSSGDLLLQQTDGWSNRSANTGLEELLFIVKTILIEVFDFELPISERSADDDLVEEADIMDQSTIREKYSADWSPRGRNSSQSGRATPRHQKRPSLTRNTPFQRGGRPPPPPPPSSHLEEEIDTLRENQKAQAHQNQVLQKHLLQMQSKLTQIEDGTRSRGDADESSIAPYRDMAVRHNTKKLTDEWGGLPMPLSPTHVNLDVPSSYKRRPSHNKVNQSGWGNSAKIGLEEPLSDSDPSLSGSELSSEIHPDTRSESRKKSSKKTHKQWIGKEFWRHYVHEYERLMTVDRSALNNSRKQVHDTRMRSFDSPSNHHYENSNVTNNNYLHFDSNEFEIRGRNRSDGPNQNYNERNYQRDDNKYNNRDRDRERDRDRDRDRDPRFDGMNQSREHPPSKQQSHDTHRDGNRTAVTPWDDFIDGWTTTSSWAWNGGIDSPKNTPHSTNRQQQQQQQQRSYPDPRNPYLR